MAPGLSSPTSIAHTGPECSPPGLRDAHAQDSAGACAITEFGDRTNVHDLPPTLPAEHDADRSAGGFCVIDSPPAAHPARLRGLRRGYRLRIASNCRSFEPVSSNGTTCNPGVCRQRVPVGARLMADRRPPPAPGGRPAEFLPGTTDLPPVLSHGGRRRRGGYFNPDALRYAE